MSRGNGTPICWVRSPNWIMLHVTYLMIAPFVGGLTAYQPAGKLPSFSFWLLHVPVTYVTLPEGVNLFPFKASLALEGRMQKTKHHLIKSLTFCVNHRWCDNLLLYEDIRWVLQWYSFILHSDDTHFSHVFTQKSHNLTVYDLGEVSSCHMMPLPKLCIDVYLLVQCACWDPYKIE